MLKAFNLRCVIRSTGSTIARFTKYNYATDKGGNKQSDETTLKNDSPVVPLQLSYNSYEDLSSDPTTPPVIIMHGKYIFNCINSSNLTGKFLLIEFH